MYHLAKRNRIDYENTPELNAKIVQQFEQQAHRERSLLAHSFIKKFKLNKIAKVRIRLTHALSKHH